MLRQSPQPWRVVGERKGDGHYLFTVEVGQKRLYIMGVVHEDHYLRQHRKVLAKLKADAVLLENSLPYKGVLDEFREEVLSMVEQRELLEAVERGILDKYLLGLFSREGYFEGLFQHALSRGKAVAFVDPYKALNSPFGRRGVSFYLNSLPPLS